ncbi:DUF6338 family protein [Streptomyces antibioticus]|uniref:DUF6338 family protein n=1 Tax=Streptomyces antibioticus TaxID=1890 RepID=UPI002257E0BD|nr:DUF6338 family protein [Streptomyces antibioticus]MCX4738117.1 DUF6338 family protein [Streptomyces antibioticus]
MPTTITGLVLLVVLLLPGLTFVIVRERSGSDHRTTPFRETGIVVFGSVIAEIITLGLFGVIRVLMPQLTPDVGRLIREGTVYARNQYVAITWWAAGLLLFSCLIAACAALVTRKNPHPSAASAWWIMFDTWFPGENPVVGCVLEDGSYVEGRQASFNVSSDDSPDRDLILVEPLKYRAPGAAEVKPLPWGAACISARQIVTMFVSYPVHPERAEGAGATQASDPAAS